MVTYNWNGNKLSCERWLDERLWWEGKLAARAVGIRNLSQAVVGFPEDELTIISNDSQCGRGGWRKRIMLTSEGLARLAWQSRKPDAADLITWLLKLGRQTGDFDERVAEAYGLNITDATITTDELAAGIVRAEQEYKKKSVSEATKTIHRGVSHLYYGDMCPVLLDVPATEVDHFIRLDWAGPTQTWLISGKLNNELGPPGYRSPALQAIFWEYQRRVELYLERHAEQPRLFAEMEPTIDRLTPN